MEIFEKKIQTDFQNKVNIKIYTRKYRINYFLAKIFSLNVLFILVIFILFYIMKLVFDSSL